MALSFLEVKCYSETSVFLGQLHLLPYLIRAGFMFNLLFEPDVGDNMLLRNVGVVLRTVAFARHLILAGFMLKLLFDFKVGRTVLLRNVGEILPDYSVSHIIPHVCSHYCVPCLRP
jgi:hypothetical protein